MIRLSGFSVPGRLDASLRLGYGALSFEYVTAEVIDRSPLPTGSPIVLSVHSASHLHVAGSVKLHVTRSCYPPPPQHFQYTDDVAVLWNRFEAYREGKEPILGMAYFCLSWLERMAGDRGSVGKILNVDRAVLNKLGELTSGRGDATEARKAPSGDPQALTDLERSWLEAVVKRLVRALGEHLSHQPERVTMQDLPPL